MHEQLLHRCTVLDLAWADDPNGMVAACEDGCLRHVICDFTSASNYKDQQMQFIKGGSSRADALCARNVHLACHEGAQTLGQKHNTQCDVSCTASDIACCQPFFGQRTGYSRQQCVREYEFEAWPG